MWLDVSTLPHFDTQAGVVVLAAGGLVGHRTQYPYEQVSAATLIARPCARDWRCGVFRLLDELGERAAGAGRRYVFDVEISVHPHHRIEGRTWIRLRASGRAANVESY